MRVNEMYTRCWVCEGVRVEHQYDPAANTANSDKFWIQNIPSPASLYEMVALEKLLEEVKESVGDIAWDAAKAELAKEDGWLTRQSRKSTPTPRTSPTFSFERRLTKAPS